MRQKPFDFAIVASCETGPGRFEDRQIARVQCKGNAFLMAQAVACIYVQVTVRHKNAAGLDVIDHAFERPAEAQVACIRQGA